jgi:hypothetical protein
MSVELEPIRTVHRYHELPLIADNIAVGPDTRHDVLAGLIAHWQPQKVAAGAEVA